MQRRTKGGRISALSAVQLQVAHGARMASAAMPLGTVALVILTAAMAARMDHAISHAVRIGENAKKAYAVVKAMASVASLIRIVVSAAGQPLASAHCSRKAYVVYIPIETYHTSAPDRVAVPETGAASVLTSAVPAASKLTREMLPAKI